MLGKYQEINVFDISKKKFSKTWDVLYQAQSNQVSPGFVFGIWEKKNPRIFQVGTLGDRRWIPSKQPLFYNTPFDLASLTKIFSTSALFGVLRDRKWIHENTKVKEIFSDFPYSQINLGHLLSHTAGYAAWEPFWEKIKKKFEPLHLSSVSVALRQEAMRELIFSAVPKTDIEIQAVYSDLSFLLLGFVLEEVTQYPLDVAVKKMVWDAMNICDSFYTRVDDLPINQNIEGVAATEDCPWRKGVLQGQVHDDNCWAMGGYGGHAGAFGTVSDLLYFSKNLFQNFYSKSTLQKLWTPISKPSHCLRTLGWDTPSLQDSSASKKFSTHSVGHLGFTGTSLWIDLDASLAAILLTNRVHPSRENILKIKDLRPRFHEALRLDLGY